MDSARFSNIHSNRIDFRWASSPADHRHCFVVIGELPKTINCLGCLTDRKFLYGLRNTSTQPDMMSGSATKNTSQALLKRACIRAINE